MSTEQMKNTSELTWTSLTPHDVIDRRLLIAHEGAFSQRVIDVDNYIEYLNTMPDTYRIVTGYDWEDLFGPGTDKYPNGFVIYKLDANGTYKPYESSIGEDPSTKILSEDQFIGDKIIFDGDDVIIINSEHTIGVRPVISVKILNNENVDEFSIAPIINEGFEKLIEKIHKLEEGEHKFDLDIHFEM